MSQTHSQAAKAATRALPEEDPEFQIAPMIDILLVLLVFFMTIATDQVMQANKDVTLPVAAKADPPDKDNTQQIEVVVNVLWGDKDASRGLQEATGRLDVDNQGDKSLQDLTDYIIQRKQLADNQGKTDKFRVVIRADKNAKYQYVRTVMIAIGNASVPTVIFKAVDKALPKEGAE